MRLQDKVAVVTGGASGFGAGIVRKFAEEGARVVVADLNVNGAHEIAAEVKGLGIHVDVADGASVAAMVNATLGAYGRLDILVNNAGITHYPAPLEEVTEQDFDKVFAVNCKSVFLTAQNIVPDDRNAEWDCARSVPHWWPVAAACGGRIPRPAQPV